MFNNVGDVLPLVFLHVLFSARFSNILALQLSRLDGVCVYSVSYQTYNDICTGDVAAAGSRTSCTQQERAERCLREGAKSLVQ